MKKIIISYILFCFSIHAWDPFSSAVTNVTEAINKRFDDRLWSHQLTAPNNEEYIGYLLTCIPQHEDKYKDIRNKIENNELNSYEALEQLQRNLNDAKELVISDIKNVTLQIENPSLTDQQPKLYYLKNVHNVLNGQIKHLSSPDSIWYTIMQYSKVRKDALTLQPIDKFRVLMHWNDSDKKFNSRVINVAEKRQQKNKAKFETIRKTSSFMVSDDDLFIIFGI